MQVEPEPQGNAPSDRQATDAVIGVGLDNLDAALFGVFADRVGLVVY